jgi:hypothetical protein
MKGYGYSYHDTVHGSPLDQYESIAKKQDDIIYDFFWSFREHNFTPFEVLNRIKWPSTPPPITSVRRSITNLEKAGKLEKLKETREGDHGRQNHVWRFVIRTKQLKLF